MSPIHAADPLDIQTKMLHKAMNGGTNGRAPVGYLNVRVEHEGKTINTVQLDSERAPLVRKAWELYATGEYGLERLEEAMANLGLTARAFGRLPERTVSFKRWHQILRDPYYLGYIQYKGDVYKGRHEPIVDQSLFDRVQEVMNLRSQNGQRDRVLQHYLKGALFCDRCERHERTSRMIYTEARNRYGKRYEYFLCRGRQDGVCDLPYLPVELVEQAIADHYSALQLLRTSRQKCASGLKPRSRRNRVTSKCCMQATPSGCTNSTARRVVCSTSLPTARCHRQRSKQNSVRSSLHARRSKPGCRAPLRNLRSV
jgi:hypothetical protein